MKKSYKILYLASALLNTEEVRASQQDLRPSEQVTNTFKTTNNLSQAITDFFNADSTIRNKPLIFQKAITTIYCDPTTSPELRKNISDILNNPPDKLTGAADVGGVNTLATKTIESIKKNLETQLSYALANSQSYDHIVTVLQDDSLNIAKRIVQNAILELNKGKNYTEIFKLITSSKIFTIQEIQNMTNATLDPILKMVYQAAGVVDRINRNKTSQVKSWLTDVSAQLQSNDTINKDPQLWFTIANTCTNAILGTEVKKQITSDVLDNRENQLEALQDALEGTLTIKGKVSTVASKARRWFKNVFNYTKLSLNIRSKFRSNSERYNMAITLIGDFDRINTTSIEVYNESEIDIKLQPKIPVLFQQISVVLQNLDSSPVSDNLQKMLITQLLEKDPEGKMIHQEIIQHLPNAKMKTSFLVSLNEAQNLKDLKSLKENLDIIYDGEVPTNKLPEGLKPRVTSYENTAGQEINADAPATTTTPRLITTEGRTSTTTTLSLEEEARKRKEAETTLKPRVNPFGEFSSEQQSAEHAG